MRNIIENIGTAVTTLVQRWETVIVIVAAFGAAGAALGLLHQRDERILDAGLRKYSVDRTHTIPPTGDEIRIAAQFAEQTLPGLRRLGLITSFTQTNVDTVIAVSGKIWKKRSMFFKEKLLDQIFIYNAVHHFPVAVRIVDDVSTQLYAEIVPPQDRLIY